MRSLASAGTTIRLYPRMVHAKCFVFDDEIAFVGSANLDERSLLLNFEIMTLVHGGTGLNDIAHWINTQDQQCTDWARTGNRFNWTIEALAESAAPLL